MGSNNDNYTPTAITVSLGGRYQIIRSLGAGSFGQTFLAADLHLPGQPQCVVKQLQPTVKTEQSLQIARRLFKAEANVLAQLGEHAQIPRLLAHFEEKEEFYLVQELIEGQDLSAELSAAQNQTGPNQTRRHWNSNEAITFLHDLLSTLSFVHTHNVIHRDLKPSNLIRRQQDQRIVLIDFGAVKQVGTQLITHPSGLAANTSHASPAQTIAIGTAGYMPPEQTSGYPQFSSDIYAAGMIAIQGLTGQYPSNLERNQNTGEVDWQHLSEPVPPELQALINKMVRYDFRTRYDSAPTALAALKALPSALLGAVESNQPPASTATPVVNAVATLPVKVTSDSTQTNSRSEPKKQKPLIAQILGLSIAVGIALSAVLGIGVVAEKRETAARKEEERIRQLELAAGQRLREAAAAKKTAEEEEAAAAKKAAEEEEAAEKQKEAEMLEAREAAITTVEQLYAALSAKDWQRSQLLHASNLAQNFRAEFFQRFEQVTVENLRVIDQTDTTIELIGQNTFIYPDGGIQIEERTYTVQNTGNPQPLVIDTALGSVIKPK